MLFAQLEKFVVVLESGKATPATVTIKVSETVVVVPGIEAVVFEVASIPPDVTSQGFPVVLTPLIAIISPS